MQGLLAAAIVLAAGCEFSSPSAATDAGAVVDATPDAPVNPTCAGYDFEFEGHMYRLVTSSMSWMQAKSNCQADGGYLLKFETQAEDNEAAETITQQTEIWIGLHDIGQDTTYLWTDGTPPAFTNWSSPPTADSPDCVIKNTLIADGRWFTQSCTSGRPAVCECTPRL
jgi:hypothetical protein